MISKKLATFAALLTVVTVSYALAQAPDTKTLFDGNSWWNHVKVLADDNMEGRDTGSPGLRRAQAYVVEQFKKAGLQPAGTEGFYQSMKLVSHEIMEKDSSAALIRNGKAEPLVLGDDAYFNLRSNLSSKEIDAPLIFVGYGLRVPENNFDELSGLDLKGKIAVYLSGAPAEISNEVASHYQSAGERWKALHRAGVIGTISIQNPAFQEIPWSRSSLSRTHPAMTLVGAEFDETQGQQMGITFNPEKAEKLFAGSGHTFAEIAALGKERKPLPRFPLAVSLKAHAAIKTVQVESANLVGKLPGSDPALKNEYVVLSAHLDHLGIGEPINGDRIYNGAMDNAAGVAVLMEIAASWKAHPERLRRSVLFVALTGEEKGMLGSRYFTIHPTVPVKSMIADINIDMFLPIMPLKVLRVQGLKESDLGDRVDEVTKALGVQAQVDPEPLRNTFIRSDQYSFVRQGIPAVKMDVGFEIGSPEEKIVKEWRTNRYHAPSDDLAQPVNLDFAARYEEIVRNLLIVVANADAKPQWKPNSFFRRFAMAAGRD